MTLAQGTDLTGWNVGLIIGIIVVLVVVALVTPIIVLARQIAKQAPKINSALREAERNTAPLAALGTTMDHAETIVAGLRRGRERLGG
jgi:predicted Holliday junction resolvase-like endonuclease